MTYDGSFTFNSPSLDGLALRSDIQSATTDRDNYWLKHLWWEIAKCDVVDPLYSGQYVIEPVSDGTWLVLLGYGELTRHLESLGAEMKEREKVDRSPVYLGDVPDDVKDVDSQNWWVVKSPTVIHALYKQFPALYQRTFPHVHDVRFAMGDPRARDLTPTVIESLIARLRATHHGVVAELRDETPEQVDHSGKIRQL